jgi:hypothetical protein
MSATTMERQEKFHRHFNEQVKRELLTSPPLVLSGPWPALGIMSSLCPTKAHRTDKGTPVLRERIAALSSPADDGDAASRRAAHDAVLAALSALSADVADAAAYMPSYDQRQEGLVSVTPPLLWSCGV